MTTENSIGATPRSSWTPGNAAPTPAAGCTFAHAGTYGHECQAPATLAASHPSEITKSGVFWARRCPSCAKIKGGENKGLSPFVPYNPTLHVNEWI